MTPLLQTPTHPIIYLLPVCSDVESCCQVTWSDGEMRAGVDILDPEVRRVTVGLGFHTKNT